MRGLKKFVGLFMVGVSLAVPYSLRAQGASAQQYMAAGDQYYAAKNYAQAARYYYAAVKLTPSNGPAYQKLGNCYYALGRKSEALAYYQRASALQPANTQLAQFVQNLRAQLSAGGVVAPATAPAAAPNRLSQGLALFQQKQYAASVPYFQQAIQQNPNDYRGYYYAGYAYYMTRDGKDAALYFTVANAKQPNASIKAYADHIKASLAPADQQWVDDQAAKYTSGAAVASAGGGGGKKSNVNFGFHLLGGAEYILADPTQITKYAQNDPNASVSLTGVTPNIVGLPELEPFVSFGNIEVNLALGYFPVGNLSYTTYDGARNNTGPIYTGVPDVWQYQFTTTIVTANLGGKILFGDKDVKGYFGINAGISPISMDFTKTSLGPDPNNGGNYTYKNGLDASSGTYTAMAINAQALLGVDFYLGKDIALGPYAGFRYLSATDFKNNGQTLAVDTTTGAVGLPGVGITALPGSSNLPLGDGFEKLTLDFSGIEGGLNLTFSF